MRTHILYNPLAGNKSCGEEAKKLKGILEDRELLFRSMTEIGSYKGFFGSLAEEDEVILCGGDGTLNRFVNDIEGLEVRNPILYYAAGSGNDFLHDLGKEKGEPPFRINEYLQNLPEVTVKNKRSLFINAVGFGIDGYCCEVGDELRKSSDGKPVNYTSIAVKGLLYGFKPCGADITVDGEKRRYEKVWIAPSMFGRFYGGGMNAAPEQDRKNAEGTLSLVVWHTSGKLKTLMNFPSIFKGEHVKHTEFIDVLTGHEITVRFDKPCALQIDGETVLSVTEYSVRSHSSARAEREAKQTAVSAT